MAASKCFGVAIFLIVIAFVKSDQIENILARLEKLEAWQKDMEMVANRLNRIEDKERMIPKFTTQKDIIANVGDKIEVQCRSNRDLARDGANFRLEKDGVPVKVNDMLPRHITRLSPNFINFAYTVKQWSNDYAIGHMYAASKEHAGQWRCIIEDWDHGDLYKDKPFTITVNDQPMDEPEVQNGAKVLLVGGAKYGEDRDVSVILDLDHGNVVCDDLPAMENLPSWKLTGGLMYGNKPMFCGGGDSESRASVDHVNCTFLGDPGSPQANLSMPRYESASLVIGTDLDVLWITGGFNSSSYGKVRLNSTEFITPGQPSKPGPDLPRPMDRHCMVRVNVTHVMVIDLVHSSRSYFMNLETQEWSRGPRHEHNTYHFCGSFQDQALEDVNVMALVGRNPFEIVVLFSDKTEEEWQKLELDESQLTEYSTYAVVSDQSGQGDGLYVIGRKYQKYYVSKKLVCVNRKCDWQPGIPMLTEMLSREFYDFALMVNPDITTCSKWDHSVVKMSGNKVAGIVEIGGNLGGSGRVLDLENSTSTCNDLIPLPLPTPIHGMTGGIFYGTTPVVCGGGDHATGNHNMKCFNLGTGKHTSTLKVSRYGAASVAIGKGDNLFALWISGGMTNVSTDGTTGELLKTSEIHFEGEGAKRVRKGPELPYPMKNHCVLLLDEKTTMIIDLENKGWVYNQEMKRGKLERGPDLPGKFHHCGGFKDKAVPEVSAAAVVSNSGSVFVKFSSGNSWIQVDDYQPEVGEEKIENVEFTAYDPTGVGTELYVGGFGSSGKLIAKKIQCENKNCQWQTGSQVFDNVNDISGFTMKVPSSLSTCS